MIKFRCIVGEYQTWREENGTGRVRNSNKVLLRAHERTVDMKRFAGGDKDLWNFFFNKMFEACKTV